MLKVLKAGFYTTIQDRGRFNYRNMGVPVSGTMDQVASTYVNQLLENDATAACLEITMTGPTLIFEEDTYICMGGAKLETTLNNAPVQLYKIYKIVAGDILSYGKLENGFRNYLAVKGGFQTEFVLGSRSFYKPLTSLNRLKDHMEIPYITTPSFESKLQELQIESLFSESVLTVSKGPEYEQLTSKQLKQLFSKEFTIAKENNRMAYQLEEFIEGHEISMLTSATLPGTVQLTSEGKIIILMRDGQTTGGYSRILQLSKKAISILAQKKYGDQISLKLIEV